MIPAAFDYVAPESLDGAISALVDGGEDAKLLAGGHSLIPLMKLRLAAPSLLVDLRKVPGLRGVGREDGSWRIGTLTTHSELEHAPELGVVSDVAATIADPQVRHRGTIGGSLAHGDSASDLPAAMLICEAEVTLQGQSGQRTLACADLFEDYLTTALAEDEVLTEIRVPALDGYGHAYQKFTRRSEDWAMAGVCAVVKVSDGVVVGRAGADRPTGHRRVVRGRGRACGRGDQPAVGSEREHRVQTASGTGADPAGIDGRVPVSAVQRIARSRSQVGHDRPSTGSAVFITSRGWSGMVRRWATSGCPCWVALQRRSTACRFLNRRGG
jgi:carbon-monoxide dehydrogenase medium subunit